MVAMRLVIAVTILAAVAGDARADAPSPASDALEVSYAVDGTVTAVGGMSYVVVAFALQDVLAPAACRWCADNAFDAGVRDALVWDDAAAANAWSNITAYGLGAGSAFGLGLIAARANGEDELWPKDALIILEAVAVAADVNQIAKLSFARQRPFVHARGGSGAEATADDNLSFYSGHTSFAFAMATASGTVATLRGYHLAPLIWGVGLTAAAATGYLRIAADKHYATDVLAGAVVGSATGILIPILHRGHSRAHITATILPGVTVVALRTRF
ncbi:MAG TPA: phosphatase PAP2 family protein [Kofleriaceae bacterium]|nr:phosphatase PAP2 family protein [Kofleriaceae bacterium]